MNAYAIIMAGGNGERLWPLSTPERPKQFVSLFGDKPLIRHAADRLKGVFTPDKIFVITAKRLVAMTRKALPHIPKENIISEPCRRDTAAAVAVACGLVKKHGGAKAIGCILTADHLMSPEAEFRRALKDAIKVASKNSAIVTMGVHPDYPATRFGYIECGDNLVTKTKTQFRYVKRFVEKPNETLARKFLCEGGYCWNLGMFIWRADVLSNAFIRVAPDIGAIIDKVSVAGNISVILKREYVNLRAISFDYAVMEKINDIIVAEGSFLWDDVGSWISTAKYFSKDNANNVCIGATMLHDVSNSIVVGNDGNVVALVGVDNLVVVRTKGATLVCAKDRVEDIKKLFIPKS